MYSLNQAFGSFKKLIALAILFLAISETCFVRAQQTIIPAAANLWAANHLYVLDKDTNSTFINANELFVASVRPLFPEIQTVTNLIGKDDFYLYDTNLATKFRNDDAQVLAGGVPFTTVEDNQPEGGVRTVVHVTKIPLRDPSGNLIGLRAIWFTPPALETKISNGVVTISFPADADIFRLERRNSLSAGDNWEPQTVSTNVVDGKLTFQVTASESQSYFRLASGVEVKIGALLSITGGWPSLAKNCEAAIQVGLESINLEQLSSGSPVRFMADIRNTLLDPATALVQLQQLATNGVRVVIGPQSSAELRVLKPFTDTNEMLLISPSSTASSLAFNDNLFRFCPDDTFEATAMVALLKEDSIEAIVPIWRDDAGNQGLHDSTALYFPMQGGEVSAGVKYAADQADFTAIVDNLSTQVSAALVNHPGKVAVYLAGFDEVAQIFEIARTNAVLSSVMWYGSDGVVQSQLLASNTNAAQFAATRYYPCPTFGLDDRFIDIWSPLSTSIKIKSGTDPDAFALAAYDALQVAVATYRTVGTTSSFADFKTAFVQAADTHTGATGSTTLNAAGDRDGGAFDFWSLKTGTNDFIWYRSISYQPATNGLGTIVRH